MHTVVDDKMPFIFSALLKRSLATTPNLATSATTTDSASNAPSAMEAEMFQIVFWSSVVLAVMLSVAVGTLATMDSTSDSLLFANDPLKKSLF